VVNEYNGLEDFQV